MSAGIGPSVTPFRQQQLELLRAVLAGLRGNGGPPLRLDLHDLRGAGFATGLTALAGHLGVVEGDEAVRAYLLEQRDEVARRHQRFAALVPEVLGSLAAAGVPVVALKGAVLCGHTGDAPVWLPASTRPMSDVDLMVPPSARPVAVAALTARGHRLESSSDHEDTFLAWGDGSVGRTDGESAEHNGRIEVHPGWGQFLHGYTAAGPTFTGQWSQAHTAAHAIGHLSSTVVRAEVRAVNVVDLWFLHAAGLDWLRTADVLAGLDPRLTAPGLWLCDAVLPEVVPSGLLQREVARLPAVRQLERLDPAAVLRDPTQRTTGRWRLAFAADASERTAVLRQMTGSLATGGISARVRRFFRGPSPSGS
ncbi:MAG: putative nucleotidyltransferase [Actinomycetota bacterium]